MDTSFPYFGKSQLLTLWLGGGKDNVVQSFKVEKFYYKDGL